MTPRAQAIAHSPALPKLLLAGYLAAAVCVWDWVRGWER